MFLFDWFYSVLAILGPSQKKAKILVVGPDVECKNTLMNILNDQSLVQPQLTPNATSEELSILKFKFEAFDLGDHQNVRRALTFYDAKVDAVVLLVDDTAMHRRGDLPTFFESKRLFDGLLSVDSLENVPFLILVNMNNHCQCYGSPGYFFGLIVESVCGVRSIMLLRNPLFGDPGECEARLTISRDRPIEAFMCNIVRIPEGGVMCSLGYFRAIRWLSEYIR